MAHVDPLVLKLTFLLFCALLGSIPFGYLLCLTFTQRDPRKFGSGNTGAANVFRMAGKKLGIFTFALDFTKGLVAVALAQSFYEPLMGPLAGILAVIGHCKSPFLKFKGGKGVSTSAGALLILSPIGFLLGALGFLLAFARFRIFSIASISSIFAAFAASLILHFPTNETAFCFALFIISVIMHRDNFDRLKSDKEKPLIAINITASFNE